VEVKKEVKKTEKSEEVDRMSSGAGSGYNLISKSMLMGSKMFTQPNGENSLRISIDIKTLENLKPVFLEDLVVQGEAEDDKIDFDKYMSSYWVEYNFSKKIPKSSLKNFFQSKYFPPFQKFQISNDLTT